MKAAVDLQPVLARSHENDPIVEQVIDAAMLYVERHGFERMTVEDLVRESGVPRTTIYRKLGSRDEILRHLLLRMSVPYQEKCVAIASGPGGFLDRLEAIITASIMNIDTYPWLKAMLAAGVPETSFAVFEAVSRLNAVNVMRRMLEAAVEAGAWRAPASMEAITHWLLRQILTVGSESHEDEAAVRRHVHVFIMPVFRTFHDEVQDFARVEDRLGAIEQGLDRLLRRLDKAGD
jgi:AcrR family transcriptional regulator